MPDNKPTAYLSMPVWQQRVMLAQLRKERNDLAESRSPPGYKFPKNGKNRLLGEVLGLGEKVGT